MGGGGADYSSSDFFSSQNAVNRLSVRIHWGEVKNMDLKNNQITVGELLDDPGAKKVLTRRFPMVLRKPLTGAARTVTLEQLVALFRPYLPGPVVEQTLKELGKL
jgi:hypothetical protein